MKTFIVILDLYAKQKARNYLNHQLFDEGGIALDHLIIYKYLSLNYIYVEEVLQRLISL